MLQEFQLAHPNHIYTNKNNIVLINDGDSWFLFVFLISEEEVKRLNIAIASSDSSYMYNEVAFSYGAGNDEYDPMKPTEDESGKAQIVNIFPQFIYIYWPNQQRMRRQLNKQLIALN